MRPFLLCLTVRNLKNKSSFHYLHEVKMKWSMMDVYPLSTPFEYQEDEEPKVEHNYHDHSNDADAHDDWPSGLSYHLFPNMISGGTGRGSEQPFPVKLHYMLEQIDKEGLSSVVSWQPHGRCFVVHKQNDFVEKILPTWFRQTKFPSFQRQLNLYGFKRLTSGGDKGGYYHECFLRTKRFLSLRIRRLKIKGTGVRRPASPQTEPNFYKMPLLPHFNQKVLEESGPTKTEMIVMEPVSQQHLGRDMADPPAKSSPVVDVSFPSCNIVDVKNTRRCSTTNQQQEEVFTEEAVGSPGSQRVGEPLPENWSLSCEPRPLIEPISVAQVYSPSDLLLAKINLLNKHRGAGTSLERFGSMAGLLSLPLVQMFQNQREPEIQPFWASCCTEDSPSISDFEDVLDSLLKMPPELGGNSANKNASASPSYFMGGLNRGAQF